MRYAVLLDDHNHTCVYFIDADSRALAVRHFLDQEWPNDPEEIDTEAKAKASYLRFEVHKVHDVPQHIADTPNLAFPVFCSDDQIFDIEPEHLDRHLAARHWQLGQIYSISERWREALPELLQAYRLDPDRFYLNERIANAYAALGDLDAAINTYQEFLTRTVPEDYGYEDALLGLAQLYRAQGRVALALEYYDKYFASNPPTADEPYNETELEGIEYIAIHRGSPPAA